MSETEIPGIVRGCVDHHICKCKEWRYDRMQLALETIRDICERNGARGSIWELALVALGE